MSAYKALTTTSSLASMGMASTSMDTHPCGLRYLIVVDAHSKWMEIVIVNSATTTAAIEKLRSMFATHGVPEILYQIMALRSPVWILRTL